MKLADLFTAPVRKAIYLGLTTLYGLELVWDFVSPVWEGKLLATLGVLGFGLAAVNTKQ